MPAAILLSVIVFYFILVFVVLRLVVPFMDFNGLKLPAQIPDEIKIKIVELENQSASAEQYLLLIYNFVTTRWHAGRIDTLYRAPLAFRANLAEIWREPGYAHCNIQNYLVYVLLVGSKFFKPGDIRLRTVFFNFFIHQYLQVQLDVNCLSVDPAGASIRGMPLGKHIKIFG